MNPFYFSLIGFDNFTHFGGIRDLLMKEKLQAFCKV